MRDKRPVDELSLAELERILAIRRREERQKQVARMARDGRVIAAADAPDRPSQPTPGVSAASLYPSDSDYDPVAAALDARVGVATVSRDQLTGMRQTRSFLSFRVTPWARGSRVSAPSTRKA